MNRFMKWLKGGVSFLLEEVLGQIWMFVIFFAGFVAWAYFSSIYAAIPVIVIGITLWIFIGKIFTRKKNNSVEKEQR